MDFTPTQEQTAARHLAARIFGALDEANCCRNLGS